MARVFVSHSSRDDKPAARIKEWLQEQGFEAPFLDFDRYDGIPPGADWEPGKKSRGSMLIFILPYLEYSDIYEAYDFKQWDIDNAVFPGTETRIGSTVIPTYLCPSDSRGSFSWPLHNYAASRDRCPPVSALQLRLPSKKGHRRGGMT